MVGVLVGNTLCEKRKREEDHRQHYLYIYSDTQKREVQLWCDGYKTPIPRKRMMEFKIENPYVPIVFEHNLGTRDVLVSIYDLGDLEVMTNVKITLETIDEIHILPGTYIRDSWGRFDWHPFRSDNTFRVVVVG